MPTKSNHLNTVTVEDLRKQFGIGAQSAKRIIKYRESRGKLEEQDLNQVPKLKPSVIEKVKKPIDKNATVKNSVSNYQPVTSGSGKRLKLNLPLAEMEGAEKVEIQFSSKELLSKYGIPLNKVQLTKSIKNRNGELQLKIPLSKHTPPGTYKTDVIAGGKMFKTTIDVVENISVSITPNRLILNAKEKSVQKELVITNNGNVPLTIDNPGGIMLEVEHIDCRVIRGVVGNMRKTKNATTDLDSILNLASRELEVLYKEAGVMRVTLNGGKYSLAPGEAKKFTFNFSIPATLKDKSYNGAMHFFGSSVHINVMNS